MYSTSLHTYIIFTCITVRSHQPVARQVCRFFVTSKLHIQSDALLHDTDFWGSGPYMYKIRFWRQKPFPVIGHPTVYFDLPQLHSMESWDHQFATNLRGCEMRK